MKIKQTLFTILVMFLFPIVATAQKIDKPDIYIFKAKIINISKVATKKALYVYNYAEFEKRENGSIFVTDFNAHWAVEMEIVAVEGENNILKNEEKITFIVHSPAREIGVSENEAKNKEVNLELHITHQEDNTIAFGIQPNLNKNSNP